MMTTDPRQQGMGQGTRVVPEAGQGKAKPAVTLRVALVALISIFGQIHGAGADNPKHKKAKCFETGLAQVHMWA